VRRPSICTNKINVGESPRIAVHSKKDSFVIANNSNQKKTDDKLPPRIPRAPANNSNQNAQGNVNYKLPPRPGSRQVGSTENNKVNQSYEYRHSREKSIDRQSADRDRSK